MMWLGLMWSVKIAPVPALPGRQAARLSASSSLTRITNGAGSTPLGATARPEAWTCPVAMACSTSTTFPVETLPGMNLKVTSTFCPRSI